MAAQYRQACLLQDELSRHLALRRATLLRLLQSDNHYLLSNWWRGTIMLVFWMFFFDFREVWLVLTTVGKIQTLGPKFTQLSILRWINYIFSMTFYSYNGAVYIWQPSLSRCGVVFGAVSKIFSVIRFRRSRALSLPVTIFEHLCGHPLRQFSLSFPSLQLISVNRVPASDM